MTSQTTKNAITIHGSAQMVSEFFYFGINNILYQRGLYPPEMFKREKKYGLSLLVTADPKLVRFLQPFVEQIEGWLKSRELHRIVLVISNVQNKEVLERWQFDIETDENEAPTNNGVPTKSSKSEQKIRQEIGDVMRQITASVTFLPLLEVPCSFDILTYTRPSTDAPDGWAESGPCMIANSQEVKLRSFSTGIHAVESKVSYKMADL